MQRASLLTDLQRAERQVVAAKRRVTDQIEAIAWLSWFGDDAVEAKALLRKFEIALAKHLSERERLRMQLSLLEGTEARAKPGHAQNKADSGRMQAVEIKRIDGRAAVVSTR